MFSNESYITVADAHVISNVFLQSARILAPVLSENTNLIPEI